MKYSQTIATCPASLIGRLAPRIRRAARTLLVVGTVTWVGTTSAYGQHKASLLAPQPLTMATGETGYIARGEVVPQTGTPRVVRGASPDGSMSFNTQPMPLPSGPESFQTPQMPMPLPSNPGAMVSENQTYPSTAQYDTPQQMMMPQMGQMGQGVSIPATGTPMPINPYSMRATRLPRTNHRPINYGKERGVSEFGSGWKGFFARLLGRNDGPTPVSSYSAAMNVGGPVPQMMSSGRPIPATGTTPGSQVAYRWYGYGAPMASPNSTEPVMAAQAEVPQGWYSQTGATAGAMPLQGNTPETPGAAIPSITNGPALTRQMPRPVPYESVYGQSGRSPVMQAQHAETTQPTNPMTPVAGKIGGNVYTPPTQAVALATPTATGTVAQARMNRHDLIPPPPLPTVRWQTPHEETPPMPLLSNHDTMHQALVSTPQRTPAANLLPPQPYVGEPPTSSVQRNTPAVAQTTPSSYVARAKLDDEPTSTPLTGPLVDKIRYMGGQYARSIKVESKSAKSLIVTLEVTQASVAQAIANRIGDMPELAPYEVDFVVKIVR